MDVGKRADQIDQAARREHIQPPQIVQPTKAVRFPSSSVAIRRAKTTAAASGTTVTANLLDSSGEEIDDAKTVNFFFSVDDSYPVIGDDTIIPVFQDIDGNWYCPLTFIAYQSVTLVTDVHWSSPTLQEKKITSVRVFDDGTTGSYTTVFTGTECP